MCIRAYQTEILIYFSKLHLNDRYDNIYIISNYPRFLFIVYVITKISVYSTMFFFLCVILYNAKINPNQIQIPRSTSTKLGQVFLN